MAFNKPRCLTKTPPWRDNPPTNPAASIILALRSPPLKLSFPRLARRLLLVAGLGQHAPLVLRGELRGALLQGVDQEGHRVGLEVVGAAHLVQVLGELLRGALQVVRGEGVFLRLVGFGRHDVCVCLGCGCWLVACWFWVLGEAAESGVGGGLKTLVCSRRTVWVVQMVVQMHSVG